MSTKSSLFYGHDEQNKNHIHIYEECFDNNRIYIEKTITHDQVTELDVVEAAILSRCFDLNELERQCNLNDDDIKKHTDDLVDKYMNNPSSLSGLWLMQLCGNEADSKEERKQKAFDNYKKKQLGLIALRDKVLAAKVSRYYFGLESIPTQSL
jgi:hypothetical protein